jgi:CheY-like chemotaxis protein
MVQEFRYPYAVRPIGFSPGETTVIDSMFAGQQLSKFRYFCLHRDNLQDPDLFLVNALDDEAPAALAQLRPSEARPALLVGKPAGGSPYPAIERPIRLTELLDALDRIVERKEAALARLAASSLVTVPERRRRNRIVDGPGDPSAFLHLRKPAPEGGVLVVDKNATFSGYLGDLLARKNIPVTWTDIEADAVEHCRSRKTALVIVNTSLPQVDPYRLCEMIKSRVDPHIRVIFLAGRHFEYDQEKAALAGCDGFLNKPVASNHVVSVLKRFLPLAV